MGRTINRVAWNLMAALWVVALLGVVPGCEVSVSPETLQKMKDASDVTAAAVEVQSAAATAAVDRAEEAANLAADLARAASEEPGNMDAATRAAAAKEAADRVAALAKEQVDALSVARAAQASADQQLAQAQTSGKVNFGTVLIDTLTAAAPLIPGYGGVAAGLIGVGIAAYQKRKRGAAEDEAASQEQTANIHKSTAEDLSARLSQAREVARKAGAALTSIVGGIDKASAADPALNEALKKNKVTLDQAYTPDAISVVQMGVMANGDPVPGAVEVK